MVKQSHYYSKNEGASQEEARRGGPGRRLASVRAHQIEALRFVDGVIGAGTAGA